MAFKPNYNQQRAERNRAKEQKKQEKKQRRDEEVAARRAAGLSDDDQTSDIGGEADGEDGETENGAPGTPSDDTPTRSDNG